MYTRSTDHFLVKENKTLNLFPLILYILKLMTQTLKQKWHTIADWPPGRAARQDYGAVRVGSPAPLARLFSICGQNEEKKSNKTNPKRYLKQIILQDTECDLRVLKSTNFHNPVCWPV